ncbi:MAG: DeoR/GlpR family DNA-binding transcription regulator [Anaeromicrobium sp.]|uniref:DeoR/GlpR family DNA-binding transcription regulator n=1 Tax=Anaeromicrobium sp. TaxID=1929132 RepID=UPI0025E1C5D6|nr:DeoR/GlpR family DNA-binding transcription regulator [Anaeromicrobium sp.]MCT4593870.1 DeoR/GlpR family DNA-binding transcription regulator [Anaeromicrobium sp.]
MKLERIKKIQDYLIDHQSASLDTLCTLFNVSKNTIRRDINDLEDKGFIKKVYGGIILNQPEKATPYPKRQEQFIQEKEEIGLLASSLIEDNDTIFIDSGSTTIHLLPNLIHKKGITIVTHSLNIIGESSLYENLNLISTGGILQRDTNSFVGVDSITFLKKINIDKAFMASTGFSIDKGVTNTNYLESEIKRTVVDISNKVVLMANDTKVGCSSFMKYCDLSEIDYYVTNKDIPTEYKNFFNENNILVLF